MFVPHASIVSSPLVRVIQPPRDHAIRRIPPPLTCVVQTCRVLMPRASQFHRSRMRSSTSCAHATPFHHRFTAHAGVPACRVLMPHHATCIGPSLLMWVVQHAACSCHVPRTFAAHVCAPARRVLMRVVRPATCSCHMPRTFNAQAVHSHAVCTCRVYRILTAQVCAPPRRVPSPRASIISSALVRVARPAVCSWHVPHTLLAHACVPTRRVLTSRASCLRRSRMRSIMPCSHTLLAHATVHRAECPRHGRRLLAAHVCSRHVHHTLAAHAYACTPSCGVLMPRTSYLHRPGVCVNMPCACAACIMSSPLTHALQPAVRSCHVRRLCSAHVCDPARRVLVPRASCLHCSCVWPHTPCAHATCLVPHRSHMRSTMPCAVSMRFRNLVTAHVCDPTCLAPPLMHMLHHAVCPCRVPRTFAASARVPSSRALVPHASCPRRAARRTMPPPRRFTARGAWCV